MQIVKLRSELKGMHIHTTIYQGCEKQTLYNVGNLIQEFDEWKTMVDLLKYGSYATENLAHVIVENEYSIREAFEK